MNKTVFISYSWQEPSAGIVNNWLKPSIENTTIEVSVDKKDCRYHDSIQEFEQKIGNANLIVAVVSKPFLKSIHCMYEMASVFEVGGEMAKRLFFVSIEELQKDDELRNHWNAKLKEAIDSLAAATIAKEPLEKALKQIELICKHLGKFMVYINDQNRLDFSQVSENNFQVVVDRLQNRISNIELPEGELATE